MKLSLFVRFYLGMFIVFFIGIGSAVIAFEFYLEKAEERHRQHSFIREANRIAEPLMSSFENGAKVSKASEYSILIAAYLSVESVSLPEFQKMLPAYEKIDGISDNSLYLDDKVSQVLAFPNQESDRFLLIRSLPLVEDETVYDDNFESYEDNLDVLFLMAILVILVIGIALVVFWVSRGIERPVRQLVKVAIAYGKTDFSMRADESALQPIGSLACSLNQMSDQLQSSLDDQRAITHAIAHELRTPLTRMRLALGMIDTRNLDEQSCALTKDIDNYISEMTVMTSSVLTFGKVSGATPLPPFPPFSADDFVSFRVKLLCNDSSIEVIKQLKSETVLCVSEIYWQLVVDNLIKNALNYADSQICISSMRNGSDYQLIIDDDGPGIPPAERNRIFLPFSRLDESSNLYTDGFGLGLAIVKSVVKRCSGRVWVEGSPLGGARFIVQLPEIHFAAKPSPK
ncbi:MAG: ATP-binding protein [Amphritea sp.]|nr:ATP-binding protein [Amphritea sp.]